MVIQYFVRVRPIPDLYPGKTVLKHLCIAVVVHNHCDRNQMRCYELGALDVLANTDPLSHVNHVLVGNLRKYLRTPF